MKDKIFVLGASSDFGINLIKSLSTKENCIIGLHCYSGKSEINTEFATPQKAGGEAGDMPSEF